MITMTGCCGCGCGADAAPMIPPRIPAPATAPQPGPWFALPVDAEIGVASSRTDAKTVIFMGVAIIFLSLRDRSFKWCGNATVSTKLAGESRGQTRGRAEGRSAVPSSNDFKCDGTAIYSDGNFIGLSAISISAHTCRIDPAVS